MIRHREKGEKGEVVVAPLKNQGWRTCNGSADKQTERMVREAIEPSKDKMSESIAERG